MKMCESDSILFVFFICVPRFSTIKYTFWFYLEMEWEILSIYTLWVIFFYFTWQQHLFFEKKNKHIYWCQSSFDDIAACLIECNFEMTKSSDRETRTNNYFHYYCEGKKDGEQYATKATDCKNIQTTITSVLSG